MRLTERVKFAIVRLSAICVFAKTESSESIIKCDIDLYCNYLKSGSFIEEVHISAFQIVCG